jgi:hypothetical protein
MLEKKVILNIKNVYTANAFRVNGEIFVGAGSETEPQVRLYNFTSHSPESIPGCPGGMMSFQPVPGKSGYYVSIMGLFPPFIGGEAGLYLHRNTASGWSTVKALDLPFAHRCEFIHGDDGDFLVAATVSRFKENPSDWSLPGEIHLIPMDQQEHLPWVSEVLDLEIFRNHGMTRTRMNGKEMVCISGAQGIFSISREKGEWKTDLVLPREVSEMNFADLDGDGSDELVTIEPFHGDTLCIYKREGKGWTLVFNDTLSFGHGLSAGIFNGVPVVVAGNRSGSLALELFTLNNLQKGIVHRRIIEEAAGPTQTQVIKTDAEDYILSANQRKNEVALYSGFIG